MSKTTGNWGEGLAAEHLESQGVKILELNWKKGPLEVDIIAEDRGLLIFVEVKTRRWDGPLNAEFSMTENQINHLARAAFCYMTDREYDGEVRFDLIAINYHDRLNYQLKHLKDAFFPGSFL
ncbi:MAG: endonuclease [Saprospirales bacterium]|nr:MAG: endonuclease [Saprospirales bacterium]